MTPAPGRPEESLLAKLERLESSARKEQDAAKRLQLVVESAHLERLLGRLPEAQRRLENVLARQPAGAMSRDLEIRSRLVLTDCLQRRGRREESDAQLAKLKELAGQAPFRTQDQAYHFVVLGHRQRRFGGSVEARREYERALRLYDIAGDVEGIAYATMCIGQAHAREGAIPKARAYLERARREAEQGATGHIRAMIFGNLGELALECGEVRSSQAPLREAIALHELFGDRWNTVLNRCALANALTGSGQGEEALEHLGRAEAMEDVSRERLLAFQIAGARCNALIALSRLEDASQEVERLLAIARTLSGPEYPAHASWLCGRLAAARGESTAGRFFDESDRRAIEGGMVLFRIGVLVAWSRWAEKSGAPEVAKEKFRLAQEIAAKAGAPQIVASITGG